MNALRGRQSDRLLPVARAPRAQSYLMAMTTPRRSHDDATLRWQDYVPQETMFWRRRIWEKVGGIDERFRFALDWDLILRFQAAGAKFHRLGRFLGAFRVHETSKTITVVRTDGDAEVGQLLRRTHGRTVTPLEVEEHLRAYRRRHVFYNCMYCLGLFRY